MDLDAPGHQRIRPDDNVHTITNLLCILRR